MTAPQRARKDHGPVQLAAYFGLERWQLGRALSEGLIPGPDRPRGRWSARIAGAALARIDAIRAAAGSIPDLGAFRAAEVLSRRLSLEVTSDGVEELARRGQIPVTGYYKDHPLYDGRALETFADTATAADATRAGQLRTAGEAAGYLRIRRSDLNHLTRSGVLKPVKHGRGPWDRRDTCSVPLYRTGDLDQLTARPDIDWAAVRAAQPGQRSQLAAIAEAEAVLAALAASTAPPEGGSGDQASAASPGPGSSRDPRSLTGRTGGTTKMTSTDRITLPAQPSDPAMFAPLTLDENKILGAHLSSGWYKQSAVYPMLSEPWQETAGLLDDLHGAWTAAFEASATAKKEAELAGPELEAGS